MSETHASVYSIKRHGTNIQDCEAEPIRTPGCIQPHGVLLVLRRRDLTVLQVSENCVGHLGRGPPDVLERNAAALFGDELAERIRHAAANPTLERNPVYLFTLEPQHPEGQALDVCAHWDGDVLLLEMEPASRTASDPPDFYTLLKRTAVRLQSAPTLEAFCDLAADEVREVTQLDRVMIYRFHPDASGEVVGEAKREDLPSWMGLRYPAHDIPASVREVYLKLRIRPLPDAAAEPAELVPLANPDTGQPQDLTHCALRGASVMYTEYLANMGVAASLTMPILREGQLWGLVAGHHYTPTSFDYQTRALAEFVAQVVSLHLPGAEARGQQAYAQRMDAVHHALLASAAEGDGLSTMVSPAPLLDGIICGGAAVYHRDRWWTVGRVPPAPMLERLGEWLRARLATSHDPQPHVALDQLGAEWPEAAAEVETAAGVLAVPVSRSRNNLVVWFRPEEARTVTWAGNPHDQPRAPGPHGWRLTPRASFALWQETVRGRSRPWLAVEVEAALKLRLLIMDLVTMRAEQIASLNEDLSRSNAELDAFAYVASHDLKEPLRGIHRHAQMLLEQQEQRETQDALAVQKLQAVLRLTTRMDQLLDSLLHFSRVGRLTLEWEDVSLDEVAREGVEMQGARLNEAGITIRIPRPLPRLRCDRIRMREVYTNLVSNALKYNDSSDRMVELGWLDPAERMAVAEGSSVVLEAGDRRLYTVRDNGIGIEPRHHEQVFAMFKRLHARQAYGGGTGAGLTIVRKLVEQHGGEVGVVSEPGRGSIFYFHVGDEKNEGAS